jgi:hypothetical protein
MQRASGIPCSLIISRDNETQTSGVSRRENADLYLLFEIRIGSRRRAVCKSTAVIDAFARRISSQ